MTASEAGSAAGGAPGGEQAPKGEAAPAEGQLKVTEYGFTEVPPGEFSTTTYTPYAAVFENPDTAHFANGQVRMTFKDAAGTVVASEEHSVIGVFPGAKYAVSGQLLDAPGVMTMDVQLLPGEMEEAPDGVKNFTVDQINSIEEEYGGIKTTAQVTSPFTKDMSDVQATAVYRDASGKVIGGNFTYISFVPAGGSTGMELIGSPLQDAPAATEIFVNVSSVSDLADATG